MRELGGSDASLIARGPAAVQHHCSLTPFQNDAVYSSSTVVIPSVGRSKQALSHPDLERLLITYVISPQPYTLCRWSCERQQPPQALKAFQYPFWNSYLWLRIRIGRWFYPQPQLTLLPYGDRLVRIGPQSIVKRGTILEVETMTFLSANTSLPLPKVWNVWTDRGGSGSGKCWFIMEYVPGETWDVLSPRMSSNEREEVTVQMKGYVDKLRGLHEDSDRFPTSNRSTDIFCVR